MITRRTLMGAAAPAILNAQTGTKELGIGIIGLGAISRGHVRELMSMPGKARIVAVCDIYKPRLDWGMTVTRAKGYHDYQDLIADPNVDVVLVLTPDHWHARMAIDAMKAGKDVDVEKPMSLTIEEAREMVRVAEETKRVLAVDSEHTAHGIWTVARQAVQGGVLGQLLWSQTSRSRNDRVPAWEYAMDKDISPRNLDWERFQGPATKRPFDAERFFRWRRYWEYSGGLITDLFVHHITPLMKVMGPEFPVKAMTSGGAWQFPLNERLETPDTMISVWDFPGKYTLLCGGSLANSVELPIVIRGHEANIFFQAGSHLRPGSIVIEAEGPYAGEFADKVKKAGLTGEWLSEHSTAPRWSEMPPEQKETWIAGALGEAATSAEYEAQLKRTPSLANDTRLRNSFFGPRYETRMRGARQRPRLRIDSPPVPTFMDIFLEAVRTRGKPALDAHLGYRAQVAVVMAVQSWREDKAVFFDPKTERIVPRPVRA